MGSVAEFGGLIGWSCGRWGLRYVMGLMQWGSELAREKMWSRIHLIPLLTAETDRDLARRHYADLAREQELLGKNSSAYNSDRYVVDFFFGWDLKSGAVKWLGRGELELWQRSCKGLGLESG